MKKSGVIVLLSAFVVACAGNPPAWWNPRQMQAQPATTSVGEKTSAEIAEQAIPADEKILLQDESYEEMALTPLEASPVSQPEPEDPSALPIPSVLLE